MVYDSSQTGVHGGREAVLSIGGQSCIRAVTTIKSPKQRSR